MARLNIEDCWWSDPRRTKLLLKIGFVADSAAVEMWRAAQEHWGRNFGLIPKHIFEQLEFASDLLEVGLAEVRGNDVYARGSNQHLSWLHEKREAGRAGGKKSAESRRIKTGTAQPHAEASPKQRRSKSKQTQPSGSDSDSSGSSRKAISDSKKQEVRFRFAKEIGEIEALLHAIFDGLSPTPVLHKIPEMIIRCEGDCAAVKNILEDLYQSPKVRAGEGLNTSKSSYVKAAILKRFEIDEAS